MHQRDVFPSVALFQRHKDTGALGKNVQECLAPKKWNTNWSFFCIQIYTSADEQENPFAAQWSYSASIRGGRMKIQNPRKYNVEKEEVIICKTVNDMKEMKKKLVLIVYTV